MRYSELTGRIRTEGFDAWDVHYAARAARDRGEEVIILSIGDPDLETPAAVVERTIAALRAGDTHYTPAAGRDELRAAIAMAHRARSGQAVDLKNVLFASGTQNALFMSSLCIAGPGDEIISFDPMYTTYPATIEVSGARLVRVRQPAARGFRLDAAALEAAVTPRTRAIFYASPNNPSGVVLDDQELAAIARVATRHDLWIVADEVYAGLAAGGRVPGLAATLPERVITAGSLSKSHAMTGWRAGWMIGPRELIDHAEAISMCMLFGLPGFVQEGALAALALSAATEAQVRDYCRPRRDFLLERLEGTPGLEVHAPEVGMFLLADVTGTGHDGRSFTQELYAAERVSVVDGGGFGRETTGCVRICFATQFAELDDAAQRIRRFCGG